MTTTIVVAGASGGIGEGAVRACLRQGASVVAVGRDARRLDVLRDHIGSDAGEGLQLVECDVTDRDSAAVTERLSAVTGGRVDGVLIAIGATPPPHAGTVLDIPDDVVESMTETNELGGLRALRALVPLTEPQGAVVNVLGLSAEVPFPNNPLMGSSNAAMRSLLRTLAVQLDGHGPRIYALVLGVVRTRARQAAGIDDQRWLRGEDVGDYTVDLVRGDVERPDQTLRYLIDPTVGPRLAPPRL